MERFCQLKFKGQGSFGKVYTARLNTRGKKKFVALKYSRISKEYSFDQIREASFLNYLCHDNIIKLLYVLSPIDNDHILVLEGMQHSMSEFLKTYTHTDQITYDICRQLILGIEYCHSKNVIHRDLKPGNILINDNYCIKIADFGQARVYRAGRIMTMQTCTIFYRPPEQLLGDCFYDFSVDIWSLGCIFFELFHNHIAFLGDHTEYGQLVTIFNMTGLPSSQSSLRQLSNFSKYPNFKSNKDFDIKLLKHSLKLEPVQRYSASQLKNCCG